MIGLVLPSALSLPPPVQRRIDAAAREVLQPKGGPSVDFTQPRGEEALVAPDSVSWRIFKNPVSLFIGGVAAVILELAEPSVRTGVWEHSSFRTDPVRRLRRTGLAAMVTVYGARSTAEATIAAVVRLHDKVTGETPAGEAYRANDVGLLTWVQATAGFGFAEAYSRYVRPLGREERDRLYQEGASAARLYGALDAPTSDAELHAQFESRDDVRVGAPTAWADRFLRAPAVGEAAGARGGRPVRQDHLALQSRGAVLPASWAAGGLPLPQLNAATPRLALSSAAHTRDRRRAGGAGWRGLGVGRRHPAPDAHG